VWSWFREETTTNTTASGRPRREARPSSIPIHDSGITGASAAERGWSCRSIAGTALGPPETDGAGAHACEPSGFAGALSVGARISQSPRAHGGSVCTRSFLRPAGSAALQDRRLGPTEPGRWRCNLPWLACWQVTFRHAERRLLTLWLLYIMNSLVLRQVGMRRHSSGSRGVDGSPISAALINRGSTFIYVRLVESQMILSTGPTRVDRSGDAWV
jgi:hypothetical protein